MKKGYADRYGIPAEEVERLSNRFSRLKLIEGFGSFDNFLKFCAAAGYQQGMRMRRCDPGAPWGPDNTAFYTKEAEPGSAGQNTEKNENRL